MIGHIKKMLRTLIID